MSLNQVNLDQIVYLTVDKLEALKDSNQSLGCDMSREYLGRFYFKFNFNGCDL